MDHSWTNDLTPMETALVKILLKQPAAIDTYQLVRLYYKDRGGPPATGRYSLVTVMNNLVRKLEEMKAPVRIAKAERLGPKPMVYWIEKNVSVKKASPAKAKRSPRRS